MAMKHAAEYVRGLWYKLRVMGVPVVGCTYIYGDNKSVLVNLGTPHSFTTEEKVKLYGFSSCS